MSGDGGGAQRPGGREDSNGGGTQAPILDERMMLVTDRMASDGDGEASGSEQASAWSGFAFRKTCCEASRGKRADATLARQLSAGVRVRAALNRMESATRRDEAAARRDEVAAARDAAAEARDRVNGPTRAAERSEGGSEVARILACAAADRARAATDRALAAEDRCAAALDREHLADALHQVQMDDLTGCYRRGLGLAALQEEVDRARADGEPLTLVCVDVDRLKAVNDREGHAAGDILLVEAVAAIRSELLSSDPLVRFGGDEFVCSMASVVVDEARARFRAVRERFAGSAGGRTLSVGFAELTQGDTLSRLIARADADLYAARAS